MSSIIDDSDFNIESILGLIPVNPNSTSTELGSTIETHGVSYSNLINLKKKIINRDVAVVKLRKTKEELKETKQKLTASTQEIKKICIDYNNALDDARKLKKVESYQRRYNELQEKLDVSYTHCHAIQSNANQLEQLVKEYEAQIEVLKIENQIAKVNTKEQTKESYSQKCDYDSLMADICLFRDLLLGKRNLQIHHKKIFKKYEKFKSNTEADDSASNCSVDDIEDVFNYSTPSPLSTYLPKTRTLQVGQSFAASVSEKNVLNDDLPNKTNDAYQDSDSNNEVVSEDTGRASSLASSEIEKCLNSPDYFISNSPISNGTVKLDKKVYTDISTSPITVQIERSDACTSPVSFLNITHVRDTQKETKDIGIQVRRNDLIAIRTIATSPIRIGVQERATSPIRRRVKESATSPIRRRVEESATSSIKRRVQESATSPIRRRVQESATSPIRRSVQERASSPVKIISPTKINIVDNVASPISKNIQERTSSPITNIPQRASPAVNLSPVKIISPTKINIVDNVASPISKNVQERTSSPITNIPQRASPAVNLSPVKIISPTKINIVDNVASPISKNIQERTSSPITNIPQRASPAINLSSNTQTSANEKENLEINNSRVCDNNEDSDCEVENILRLVRLDYNLITPIPISPAKQQKHDNIQSPHGYPNLNEKVIDELVKMRTDIRTLSDYVFTKLPVVSADQGNHKSYNCDGNDLLINSHKIDLANKPRENCEAFESPIQSAALKSNIISCPEPINVEISSEVDKENSENRIISQEYTINSPIEITEKNAKKLTRLEKMRKKLLPKSKIRRALTPPIKKISRRNQIIFKKKVHDNSAVPAQNNKIAYENAVKVMAEIRAKEKNKSIKSVAPDAVKKIITKDIHIVISKCDIPVASNKNIVSTAESDKTLFLAKSSVKPNSTIESFSNIEDNVTKMSVSETSTNINDYSTSLLLRRSKLLSSSASNNSDVSNKTVIETGKESILNEVQSCKRLKSVDNSEILDSPSNKIVNISKSSLPSNICSTEENVNISPSNTVSKPIEYRRKSARLSTTQKNESEIKKVAKLDSSEGPCNKRVKISKSSPSLIKSNTEENVYISPINSVPKPIECRKSSARLSTTQKNESEIIRDTTTKNTSEVVTYNDLDIFFEQTPQPQICKDGMSVPSSKDNILCKLIEKHALSTVRWGMKKLPEKTVNSICAKLEDIIAKLNLCPNNVNEGITITNNLRQDLRKCDMYVFLAGLMKYLMDPARKVEMSNKVRLISAPPMTRSERVLVPLLKELRYFWRNEDFIEAFLKNIEYKLLKLNHTPEFVIVESLSHLYAIVCRFIGDISRLRSFMIDAMYCIQFKSIAIIKQCTEVWMHILPLAHMGQAKRPIVICLVYLLHFFKCEDKFNKVQDMRSILTRKYFYKIYEWSESDILEMLQNAINELKDDERERKMLRMCLIVFAKRKGPNWCQQNIVRNMLLPLINKPDTPELIKEFCVYMLGPLVKPYPSNMKLHNESVFNDLVTMLDSGVTPTMEEAIISSLLHVRHNQDRVIQILMKWNPVSISAKFEEILAEYIKDKPAHVWKAIIRKMRNDTDKYDDCVNL